MARRRARKESTARKNPDLDTSVFTEKVAPGFGAYAATRFLSRAAFTIADKRKMKSAKHVAVGVGLGTAAAVWAFGDRVKQTQKFYEPILIGAGTAAVQGLIQAYMPRYGWMTGDLPKASPVAAAPSAPSLSEMMQDDDLEMVPLLLPGQPPPAGTVTQGDIRAEKEEALISELSDYSEMND